MSYSKNCKGGCLFYFAEKPQSIYCTNFPLTRKIRSNDTGLICKMWLRWQGHSFTVSTWQNSDAFNVNETHREKLWYNSGQEFFEIKAWLRLTFFICLHNQLNSIRSTVCYYHVTYKFQSKSTLYSLPECQGTPCSKKAPYLIKWQQRDSSPQPLSL